MRLIALVLGLMFLVSAAGCHGPGRGRGPVKFPPGKIKPKRLPAPPGLMLPSIDIQGALHETESLTSASS
ncbi:MAG: hypothetical protein OEZ55_12180 [Nitrospinota bacterium]|nr:hypothetical protein [Nitrospinota bacterium]